MRRHSRREQRKPPDDARAPGRVRSGQPARRGKRRFDVAVALRRIRAAVEPFPKAALFQLYDAGIRSLFGQLVACILSIRTRDEVTAKAAARLLEAAPAPAAMSRLSAAEIDRLIGDVTFHHAKASQIREIARTTMADHGGELPCDFDVITGFGGVGPKCAGLALGIACGQRRIGVDVHVHRVTNRWGYIATRTPEQTMAALQERLPRRFWVTINALLVPFGKHICTGRLPRCSSCPVLDMCRQVGVGAHR
jgi:endonuclease-3